jgi:hypothetical protein
MHWQKIKYDELNARAKENYNFAQLSALLADYGYVTMRLTDDCSGADFIARHVKIGTILPVQLKGRLHFKKKYQGRGLFEAFFDHDKNAWYLFPHDELLDQVLAKKPSMAESDSWKLRGGYSFPRLDPDLLTLLHEYRIQEQTTIGLDSGEPADE